MSTAIEHHHHDFVRTWQEDALDSVGDKEAGVIARLLNSCLSLYSLLLQEVSESQSIAHSAERSLRRSHATLKLWADGHAVLEGGLDRLLENSKSLQDTTLATLNALCGVLLRLSKSLVPRSDRARILRSTDAQVIHEQTRYILTGSGENASDSESDSSDDELENTDLDDTVEEAKTYTRCLLDLSGALQCPAIDPNHEDDQPNALQLGQRSVHENFTELIKGKYPKAGHNLVDSLGRASWQRYQRLQSARSANANKNVTLGDESAKSHIADSEFKDSGLGTSIPNQSTYAETVISFVSSLSEGSANVHIPPLPSGGKKGLPFECTACGGKVRATNNRVWRRHLFHDLQPYSCLLPDCIFTGSPFRDRKLWSVHLELGHGLGPNWESQHCTLCLEHTGDGKNTILSHFARHMEDISLAALPRGIDSDVESDSASDGENSFASEPVPVADPNDATSSRQPRLDHDKLDSKDSKSLVNARPRRRSKFIEDLFGGNERSKPSDAEREEEEEEEEEKEKEEEEEEEEEVIRCVCGREDDDANVFVQCDSCKVWQHGRCVGIIDESASPDEYFCERCRKDLHVLTMTSEGRLSSRYLPVCSSIGAIPTTSGEYHMSQQSPLRFVDRTPRVARIPPQKWEEHKEELRSLYQRMKLDDLMSVMKTRHSFEPTKRQYVYQFERWNLKKSAPKSADRFKAPASMDGTSFEYVGEQPVYPPGRQPQPLGRIVKGYGNHYFCPFSGCARNHRGFDTQKDKCLEHIRTVHEGEIESRDSMLNHISAVDNKSSSEISRDNLDLGPKTFVCNLCSRRFRRQEHLKRHYRSLHLHYKPFELENFDSDSFLHVGGDDPSLGSLNADVGITAGREPSKIEVGMDTAGYESASHQQTGETNEPTRRLSLDTSDNIKCICGFLDDDGHTVLCEKCDTWQHIICYYESAQHVPDVHECTDCFPRFVDADEAAKMQRQRRYWNNAHAVVPGTRVPPSMEPNASYGTPDLDSLTTTHILRECPDCDNVYRGPHAPRNLARHRIDKHNWKWVSEM